MSEPGGGPVPGHPDSFLQASPSAPKVEPRSLPKTGPGQQRAAHSETIRSADDLTDERSLSGATDALLPMTAFSHLPPVHGVELKGRLRVEPFRSVVGPLGFRVSDSNHKISKQNLERANWGPVPGRCRDLFSRWDCPLADLSVVQRPAHLSSCKDFNWQRVETARIATLSQHIADA
jgi:hypothetical protein